MLLPEFKRGDSFELPLAVRERDSSGIMRDVNITGWVFKMDARENDFAGRVVQRFQFQVDDALAGKGRFVCLPEVTRRWPLGNLVFDISVRDSNGKEITSRTMSMPVAERISR